MKVEKDRVVAALVCKGRDVWDNILFTHAIQEKWNESRKKEGYQWIRKGGDVWHTISVSPTARRRDDMDR